MSRRQPIRPLGPQRMRMLVGSGLLLLYVVVATPFVPALTALLAATDRSHHVAIQQTSRGVQVVLRHDCINSASRRHGMVARVLTLFAGRPTPTQPDHVIQFAASGTVQQALMVAVAPLPQTPALDEVAVGNVLCHSVSLNFLHVVFARPPPATSVLLLTVRSTVLLV